ncbi:hypothetical protein F3Y22_tig00110332pilonHSYRG00063 [Hibiscus syriacus]|uniref:Uncharacterized protein n=1 Tax=Hibiscus syriacus TaxID=106335 RepID=A0A6A3AXY7_HIBSY|nr:hypothetical protein F3Y22_tig00110332pilonHSYRG00063 [Hibiscus syriacus]
MHRGRTVQEACGTLTLLRSLFLLRLLKPIPFRPISLFSFFYFHKTSWARLISSISHFLDPATGLDYRYVQGTREAVDEDLSSLKLQGV